MAFRRGLAYTFFLAGGLLLPTSGCEQKPPPPPPPEVTKEMQETAPPVIDFGGAPANKPAATPEKAPAKP